MNNHENKTIETIKEKAQEIDVPVSVQPDQILKKLEEHETKKKKVVRFPWKKCAAACVVLLFMGGVTIPMYQLMIGSSPRGGEGETKLALVEGASSLDLAKDYDEIFDCISKAQENMYEDVYLRDRVSYEEAATEDAANMNVAKSGSASADTAPAEAGEYSTTNTREKNVDEADVVKTDGKYLYIKREQSGKIAVVKADDQLEQVSEIELEKDEHVQEMYVLPKEKKLIAIAQLDMLSLLSCDDSLNSWSDRERVEVITYDISNPKKIVELGRVAQNGFYDTSRVNDGYLYLFGTYGVDYQCKRESEKSFVPLIQGKLMPPQDIMMPPQKEGNAYEIVSSIQLSKPDQIFDSKAFLGAGGSLYVGERNIYYYQNDWRNEQTTVRKMSYNKGELTGIATGVFAGYLNDSFSIDEYQGNLRVVTTEKDVNHVFVMDEKLNIIGKIKGLAKDERVYSARFMGDTAYFVTFRETDPLFSVDLSNPKEPKILGELKIPGFSDYLHSFSDHLLLGVGMSIEDDANVISGVKLSMFDVSDKKDVKEVDTYIIDHTWNAYVSNDYRAIWIDKERGLIGLNVDGEGDQMYDVFVYSEKEGFRLLMEEPVVGDYMGETRGIQIKDRLYVANENVVQSYRLSDFHKVADLVLR